MISIWRVALVGAIGAIIFGCSSESSGTVDESIDVSTEKVVQSGVAVTPFGSPNAAETAITIVPFNGTYNKVVAFNFDDPAHIAYTPTTRVTSSGASGIGWNYSIGGGIGNPFTGSPKRLTPPAGWPILWGDPGIGQSGNGLVFMTTLAVPQSKMPAGGGTISGSLEPYLGGACVARSSDGGQNFSVTASDCLHDASFNFYDGSDVTGTTATGPVAAAFYSVDFGRIDVWIAPTPTSPFAMVATPFPGKNIVDHPRLAHLGTTGIAVLAADSGGNLWLSYYNAGAWTAPLLAGTGYSKQTLTIGGQSMRRGAQYDLAFAPSTVGPGYMEVVFTKWNGHSIISNSFCNSTCTQNFRTVDPGVNVFNPAVGTFQQGNPGGASTFEVMAWTQAVGGTNVQLFSSSIAGVSGPITGHAETGSTPVCPDTRSGGGYWGDYDAHLAVLPQSYPTRPLFWQAFSDSTDGSQNPACTQQWTYRSTNVNVSATWLTS
jgi:hypothetical protein